ncbi:MAG: hypothetical protein QOD71_2379 [Thermoleophilaceae bacterium]|jgi:hypothetical protein|nr:hypothetical protein [Thermoleophilaceae bacterium]
MGRRSRKRGGVTTRAERDAARRAPAPRRPPASERPSPPWGSFPLSELVILIGIVVMVWGFLSGRDGGKERVAAGLILSSLGGGELALREHLAGYRSHSALLAGVAAFVVVTALALTLGPVKVWVLLLAGAAVFGGAFYGMRELFKRRSGGLGFR